MESKNPKWEVISILDEIPTNKIDTLKIARVKFGDKDLVNLQVWRRNTETNEIFPLKDQRVSFNIDLKDRVSEAIEKAL